MLQVVLKEDGFLYLVIPGQPEEKLIPFKGVVFSIQRFSNMTFEFVVENGQVTALKQKDPSGNTSSYHAEIVVRLGRRWGAP